jgi:phosphate:Na+ symporter
MIGQIVGGLGLFLLGMWLMTEGLKLAAGDTLKSILESWTRSPLRGLLTGIGLTSVVQSSSAVTMATIGFSNAGLLSLEQAIWLIYGANVGTTMTGWLVAVFGFKLDIGLYAMPLVGVGMALRLTGGAVRRAAWGQTIAGFGVLFLGIATLKAGFEGLATQVALPDADGPALLNTLIYVAAGIVLTTLMQSSSALLVIALSAVSSGLVTLPLAGALVIGAAIGTTTTAVLGAIGATPTAKRVASAHVIFAMLASVIGILVLGPLMALIERAIAGLGFGPDPTLALVAFYTTIKLLGVLAIWPLTPALTRALGRRFVPPEAEKSRLRYLDRTVLEVPALAIEAGLRETGRLREIAVAAIGDWMVAPRDPTPLRRAEPVLRMLADGIAAFLAQLSRSALSPDDAARLQTLMRTLQHYMAAVHDAQVAQETLIAAPEASAERAELHAAIRDAIAHPERMSKALEEQLKVQRDMLKEGLLQKVSGGRLQIDGLDDDLRGMNAELRMLRHLRKGHEYLERMAGGTVEVPEANAA